MKFTITIYNENWTKSQNITGLPTLADAIACAHTLAMPRKGGACVVKTSGPRGERLAGFSCEYKEQTSATELARAEIQLRKVKAEKKAAKARHAFIKDHGGFDAIFNRILADETAKAAFFRNDFPTVITSLKLGPIVEPQTTTTT